MRTDRKDAGTVRRVGRDGNRSRRSRHGGERGLDSRVRAHQEGFRRFRDRPVSELGASRLVKAYYGLTADTEAICRSGEPAGAWPLTARMGSAVGSVAMAALGTMRQDHDERLDTFWNDQIARPLVRGSRVEQKETDPFLSTEYGSFCLEFDLPALDLAGIVFWELRQLVAGRRGPDYNGTAFAEGRSHLAAGTRQFYFVTLLRHERIVKIPVHRLSLLLGQPADRVTSRDIDVFGAELARVIRATPMHPYSARFDAETAHARGIRHEQRLPALPDPDRVEVADLRINVLSEDLPLDIVQYDRRSLTANGTPVVLNVGPVRPEGLRRVVGKYHHTYSDGAVVLAEARLLGTRPASDPREGDAPGRRTDRVFSALDSRARARRELIPVSMTRKGTISTAHLDRGRYMPRISDLRDTVRRRNGHGAYAEFEIGVHLVFAMAVLVLARRESLHFLEAVPGRQSLAPSLLRIPPTVLETIRQGGEPGPGEREQLVAALKLWQVDRREVREGRGVIPTMAVVSGALRRPLRIVGRVTDPGTTADLMDTLLLSMLVRGRTSPTPGDTRVHGFSTAIAEPYQQGAFGAIDTDDGRIMLSVRTRAGSGGYGLSTRRFTIVFEQVLEYLERVFPPEDGR
jgi:hypothetical protein